MWWCLEVQLWEQGAESTQAAAAEVSKSLILEFSRSERDLSLSVATMARSGGSVVVWLGAFVLMAVYMVLMTIDA